MMFGASLDQDAAEIRERVSRYPRTPAPNLGWFGPNLRGSAARAESAGYADQDPDEVLRVYGYDPDDELPQRQQARPEA